jgi:single-stranded-DNA-specific exonuclease
VVPLRGLNGAFVAKGLQVMRARRNPGLRALADAAALAAEPAAYHLGFVLGPRINAGGRIGDAALGARLLSTDDDLEAARIAETLDRLNAERKAIEASMTEEAAAQADFALDTRPDASVLIVHGEDWHRGVVGLVASRLTERFARPAIAVAWEKDGTGAGSARSVPGVDIGSAVAAGVDEGLLVKGGGHVMAAGLTIARDRLNAFAEWLQARVAGEVHDAEGARELRLDGALMPAGASAELMDMLEKAGPFGAGNPRPRFAFAAHRCAYAKIVGESHVRCTLTAGDGSRIGAIAFRAADTPLGALLLESGGLPLHVAGHLRRDQWNGRETIELVIEDAARPAGR